jgi:hypothetical protein
MRWRRISEVEVRAVLAAPDREEPTRKGRKNAWRAVDNRLLKVAYREEAGRLIVVTVVDKRE